MANSKLANSEKPKVWEHITEVIGPLQKRKNDWRTDREGLISVFVTFSKFHEGPRWYFYDINQRALKEWLAYKRAFVVFVMGSHEDVLVIPAHILREQFIQFKTGQDYLGNYKLNFAMVVMVILFISFQHLTSIGFTTTMSY